MWSTLILILITVNALNFTNTTLEILQQFTPYYVTSNGALPIILSEFIAGYDLMYVIDPSLPFIKLINTAQQIKNIALTSSAYYSDLLTGSSYTNLVMLLANSKNYILIYNFSDPSAISLINSFRLTDGLKNTYSKIKCFGFMVLGDDIGPYLSFCGAVYNSENYLILSQFKLDDKKVYVLTKQELKMSPAWDYFNYDFKQSNQYSIMYKKCTYDTLSTCQSQIVVLNPYSNINMPIELFTITASNLGLSALVLLQAEIIDNVIIASDANCSCVYFIQIQEDTLSPVLLSKFNLLSSDRGGYFNILLDTLYVGGLYAFEGLLNIYIVDITNPVSPQLSRVLYLKTDKFDMITSISVSLQFICATLAQKSSLLVTLAFFYLKAKNFVALQYFMQLDSNLLSNYSVQVIYPDDDTFAFVNDLHIISLRAFPQQLVINGSMTKGIISPTLYNFTVTAISSDTQSYLSLPLSVTIYPQLYGFAVKKADQYSAMALPHSGIYINGSTLFHGNILSINIIQQSGNAQPTNVVNLRLIRSYDSTSFAEYSKNGTLFITFLDGSSVYKYGLILTFFDNNYSCHQFSYSGYTGVQACSSSFATKKKSSHHYSKYTSYDYTHEETIKPFPNSYSTQPKPNIPQKYTSHLAIYSNVFAYLYNINSQYFITFYNFNADGCISTYYYIYDTYAYDNLTLLYEGCPENNEIIFIGLDKSGRCVAYMYQYQPSNNFKTVKLTQTLRYVFETDIVIKVVYIFDSYFLLFQSKELKRYTTIDCQIPFFKLSNIIDFCKFEDYLMVFRNDNTIGIYDVHSYQTTYLIEDISLPSGYNLYKYVSFVVHYSNTLNALVSLFNPSQPGNCSIAYIYRSAKSKIVIEFIPLMFAPTEYITYVSLYLYFAIIVTNKQMYSYRYMYNTIHISLENSNFTNSYSYLIIPNNDTKNAVQVQVSIPSQSIEQCEPTDAIRITGLENNLISLFNYLKFFDATFSTNIARSEYTIYYKNLSSYYIVPPLSGAIIGSSIFSEYMYVADAYGVVKYTYVDDNWTIISESSFDNVSATMMLVYASGDGDMFAILGSKNSIFKLSIQQSSNNKLFEKYAEDFYSSINIFHRSSINNILLVGYASQFNIFMKIYKINSTVQLLGEYTDATLGIDNFEFSNAQLGHIYTIMYLFFQEGFLTIDYSSKAVISYYSFSSLWSNHTILRNDKLVKGYVDRNQCIFLIFRYGGYFRIETSITSNNGSYSISFLPPIFYPNYKELNILSLSYNDYHALVHYAESTDMQENGSITNYLRFFSFEEDDQLFPIHDCLSNSLQRNSISLLSAYFGQFAKSTPFSLIVEQYNNYLILTNYSIKPLFEYNYLGLLQSYEQEFKIIASTIYNSSEVSVIIGLQTEFDNKMISLIFFIIALIAAVIIILVMFFINRIHKKRMEKKLKDEYKMKT